MTKREENTIGRKALLSLSEWSTVVSAMYSQANMDEAIGAKESGEYIAKVANMIRKQVGIND